MSLENEGLNGKIGYKNSIILPGDIGNMNKLAIKHPPRTILIFSVCRFGCHKWGEGKLNLNTSKYGSVCISNFISNKIFNLTTWIFISFSDH